MQVYTKHTLVSRFIPSEKVFHNPAVSARNRKLFPFPERKKGGWETLVSSQEEKLWNIPRGEIVTCVKYFLQPPASPFLTKDSPSRNFPLRRKLSLKLCETCPSKETLHREWTRLWFSCKSLVVGSEVESLREIIESTGHVCPHGWRRGWTSSSWCSAGRPSLTPDPLSRRCPSTESLFWNVRIFLVCTKHSFTAENGSNLMALGRSAFISSYQRKRRRPALLSSSPSWTLARWGPCTKCSKLTDVTESEFWFLKLKLLLLLLQSTKTALSLKVYQRNTWTRRSAMKSFRKSANLISGWALLK